MEFTLFCRKICFAAIYAVLLRNLFCRGLRTFCVETNHGQNVVRGEKMTYIMYDCTTDQGTVILYILLTLSLLSLTLSIVIVSILKIGM